MLLGLEKLGLAKLNIIGSSDIFENVQFQEYIYSVINSGKNEQENLYFYEKIESVNPPLSVGVIESLNFDAQFKKVLLGKINVFENSEFLENINSDIESEKNILENLDFLENINQNSNPDLNIYENLNLSEILNLIAKSSINILESVDFTEYLNSEITGYNLEINESRFTDIISSGQVLTVNSNNYTAFLNLENVIDKYNGEWIFVSPETQKINIQPLNQDMEIWIEYQELFL